MPYVQVRVSIPVEKAEKEKICRLIGEKITLMPGKTEAVLMTEVRDDCTLLYRGENGANAFVTVCLNNKPVPEEDRRAFARAVFVILRDELGIPPHQANIVFQYEDLWLSDRNTEI